MKLNKCLWLLPIALAAVAMVAAGQVSAVVSQQLVFQGTHPSPTGGGGGHLVAQGTHPSPTGGGGGHLVAQGTHPSPTGGGGHLVA